MGIEQVCNESKVELGVSGDKRCWSQELAAAKSVGILKNLLCSLEEVTGL